MTELQMGLIGLGAAAVAGVLGYNKWQEMRQRKLAQAVLKPHHDDVLLGGRNAPPAEPSAVDVRSEPEIRIEPEAFEPERVEPMLAEPEPEPAVPETAAAEIPVAPPAFRASPEPLPVDDDIPPAAPVNALPAGEPPVELLDPRLEYVVAMDLVEAVPARQIVRSQREVLHRLGKPVHWIGYNEAAREWQRLTSDCELEIRRLRVGLQLVNRLGPLSEGDLTMFSNAMRVLADELMAVVDLPAIRVLDQAAEVDRFCAAVDLEIGLNLISRGIPFPGTKIRALAEAAGMVLGIDGLFTRYDDDGRALFSLQNYENTQFTADAIRTLTTHGLTFLLDVPRVENGERVFVQMTDLARRFGEALQGALVDDNRQPLNDAQLDHIRREFIGKPQATMAAFGVPAGSPRARRLFS